MAEAATPVRFRDERFIALHNDAQAADASHGWSECGISGQAFLSLCDSPKRAAGHDPGRTNMTITRRHILAGAIAAPAVLAGSRLASAAVRTVKISHQFPGGTATEGDFRD